MRSDIAPSGTFPDYELRDHENLPEAQRDPRRRPPSPDAAPG